MDKQYFVLIFIFNCLHKNWAQYTSQCPPSVQLPCSCATTRYEPVQITCDNAASLGAVLAALGQPVFNLIIDTLIISNTPIEYLPAVAFQGHAVKRLILRNNRLSAIDAAAFDGPLRTSLQELEIRNNFLTGVPLTGIPRLQSLTTLILAKNRISNLQRRAFEFYASKSILRKLDFSANLLQDVDAETFYGGLTSMQEINFDKNFLTKIPTPALRFLQSLEDLSFGVNQLTEIPLDALPFPNLKSLSLEVNRIEKIDANVFRSTPQLLYLYLSANNISQFDGETFKNLPRLKVLAMGNNAIAQLNANSFRHIPGLVRLELSECRIERIDPGVFQTIPKVQVIVLNKNRLTQIDSNMFQSLSDLYSLDLKGNSISYVGDRSFANLRAMRHLDISSNKMSTLSPGTFLGTFERTVPPTTRVLYIYENPWNCDERIEWLRRWLRDNQDMMIDAPGYPSTICAKPDWLRSWPIRSPNPFTTSAITSWPPMGTTGDGDGGTADLLEGTLNDTTKLSTANLTALLLGIILGVFLLTLLLLMIVRYFVSKNRRDMKEREEERRRFGSTLSSYQPPPPSIMGGPVYPSPPIVANAVGDEESPPDTMRRPRTGYFLNRPWYWWF